MNSDSDELCNSVIVQTQTKTGHEQHCFIVMPFGREKDEQKWFKGWYEVVIKPAVIEAGYEPILAAAEEQPGAINDDIRTHLAFDPMVIVDLGGEDAEDDPNPNVMYELGIRHALGLPLVIMAWKNQRLPFDVSNQRVIMEERDLLDIDVNKKRLHAFIQAAKNGNYYRPMEAIKRLATIQAASENLGEDSVLRALVQEVQDLRSLLSRPASLKGAHRLITQKRVKTILRGKPIKKVLYAYFSSLGGSANAWAQVLRTVISDDDFNKMKEWSESEWMPYLQYRLESYEKSEGLAENFDIDAEVLEKIKTMLPQQPWPTGTHKEVASKIGLTNRQVAKYIAELIRRGDFLDQNNGQVVASMEATNV